MTSSDDANALLLARIQALEEENGRLCTEIQNLQLQANAHSSIAGATKKKNKCRNIENPGKRFVALKMMYIGSRYHGFASQGCTKKTVESEFFTALIKSNLLLTPISEAAYSRCGRTDRGVSATYQVVALYLRSISKGGQGEGDAKLEFDRVHAARESQKNEESYAAQAEVNEIDYVSLINRFLPDDIRILGWCPVPPGFSARFNCLFREYKYFFIDDGLDIEAMQQASQKLVGEHDFRNFCRMDVQNVHNYRRKILEFKIFRAKDSWAGKQLWVMHVTGQAFLWHQVRCMAAVLFMVGRRHERPSIVEEMLDTGKVPRKPQYVMASELPLVLRACGYQGLKFRCKPDAKKYVQKHLEKVLHETLLSAAVISEGIDNLFDTDNEVPRTEKVPAHIPLLCRPTEPTYDERRAKLAATDVEISTEAGGTA